VKIEPRLPQLPSLGELLEHPRVKGLIERVNRSTIAQRASGFLEEIRSSLVDRAGHADIPSLTHLAERLARRLLGEPLAAGPVSNATGVVYGDPQLAMPWPDQALHAVVQLAGDYHRRDARLTADAEHSLCTATGGEAAFIASTLEGAVTLAAASVAGGRELTVYGSLDSAGPLDWRHLAARSGCALLPPPADAERRAARESIAAVLRAPDAEDTDLENLASSVARDGCLIDVAPWAGLLDPREYGFESVPTIRERLDAGADLVLVDGSGLLGGPDCGLLIGRRGVIESVARHPLAPLVAPSPHLAAALEAVLQVHRDDGGVAAVFQLPVWQLLTAPMANLQQRAERLASLIAGVSGVANATAREAESPWRRWGGREWSAPSWSIDMEFANEEAASVQRRLARGPRPIVAQLADQCVRFNLRSVFPRWDQRLVAAVEELGPTEAANP
jgi:L-seryl-tRNA(Ser) seleniumtransferase